ncbi:hypothetical protein niasHS_009858 [Heterodera schachtii]|uniref:Uncharacterized protein n=1 Tax=Heterodera schachtii TaxID=97005 RepID=A0ABD2JAR5_HETSC
MDFPGVPCLNDFQIANIVRKNVHTFACSVANFAPTSFSVDFEMAISNAVTTIFPGCQIRNAVTALDTEFGNLAAFRPLIDWLLDNYVGRPRPNGTWSQPLFRPDQWNVYQRTLDGDARTNNNAEAEHHRLQGAFNCRHPSLWHFIDVLRREQKIADNKYNSAIAGDCHLRKSEANIWQQIDEF